MKRLLFLHIILLFSVLAWSQGSTVATALPYECSFEETDDLTPWVLNAGTPSSHDKWMYGTAVHSAGRRSLYVSEDGQNPGYTKKKTVLVSYLRYKFPSSSRTEYYDVNFDWKGIGDEDQSCVYVMVCPEDELSKSSSAYNLNALLNAPNAVLSNQQLKACQTMILGDSLAKYLSGGTAWQNVSLSKSVGVTSGNSSKNFVFLFIWVNQNSQTTDTIGNSSIAIDNFQINTNAISKPNKVQVYPHCEDSTLLVAWESNQPEFDIQYRQVGDVDWVRGVQGINDYTPGFVRTNGDQCEFYIPKILEGSYDIRIRSSYYDDETSKTYHSNYVYVSQVLVYCPENHCINYIDLYDAARVTCTYGMNPDAYDASGQTPYTNVGVIDFGPDAIESRHTLHVDPTEVDPRTDSLLHTVPPGALASVRLGNWNWHGEAEAITYDIHVDSTNQGILIVKYAVVLENPGTSHTRDEEPRFELQILDQYDQLIDPGCGHAVFSYSDGAGAGWQKTKGDKAVWKDWTTVGVNLMPYHGQDIKVRFTTYDCSQSGHYGYAYFTVDCANGHIETENCGLQSQVTCIAPAGFSYYWYKNDNYNDHADPPYDQQTLVVDATRTKYTCRVSFIEQPDCYFEISTTSEPRFPVPEYTYEPVYDQCTSALQFTNTSHVMNKFEGYENHTSEKCNESHWFFRSLVTGRTKEVTTWSPTYPCREYGDSIEVTLTSYLGVDNSCDSTIIDTIITPNIVPQNTEYHYSTCSESPVKFDGKWFSTDTIYTGHFFNFAGCDSLSTLYLRVYPKPEDKIIKDSICSDDYVLIDGKKYNQSCENFLIMLKTKNGCDSALYLTLTVNERIQADVQPLPFACADDEVFFINYDIHAGQYDSLHIAFSTPQLRDTTIYDPDVNSIAIPYPASITPGHYTATITFYQFCCGKHIEQRAIDVRYMSSIVEQKWNDVLTLLAPAHNGGYEFLDYQWFKNNEPLLGENHSYLYQPLDTTAEYYVVVTRKDSVQIATCPIQPVYHEQQSKYPSVVKAGQKMRMYMAQETTIWYYTVSGQLYSTFTMPKGHGMMDVPNTPGVYVLRAVDKQGETQAQVLLVE